MNRSARNYALSGALLLAAAVACQRLLPAAPDFLLGLLYGLGIGLLFAAVVRAFQSEGCDEVTPAVRRRYQRELLPAMVAYILAVALSVWLLKRVDAVALRALIALLPVPAIALAMRAIVRRIRDADELQRRIELEAVSIAAAFISMGYLAAGFLQRAGVIDVPSSAAMIWMFPLVCFTFGLSKTVLSRRYR
jgi:predicted nucleic acid-binding Zn ribbon protein